MGIGDGGSRGKGKRPKTIEITSLPFRIKELWGECKREEVLR